MAKRQSIGCTACSAIASSSQQRQVRTLTSSARLASSSQAPRSHLQPIRLSTHFQPTQKASQVSQPSSSSSSSSSTSHDDPLPSLQLLLRGGYIRASSSGVFTLLPTALRIVRKITQIIDHELSAISASRLALPNLLPSKLWHQTGRYSVMGSELYKLRDRRQSEFVLGPTHEEEVTKLVAHDVESDRQLPLRLYQITTKFRDEPRPRMGLLRTKEFLMKDLYSFDRSAADAVQTYDEVRRAYASIFDRVFGVKRWKAAEADTGAIGGNKSHEYHVEDPAGEDTLISCRACEYTANTEKAVSMPDPAHMPISSAELRVLLFGCHDVKVQGQVMHAFVLPASRRLNDVKLEKLVAKLPATGATDKIQLLHDSSSTHAPQWDWKDRPEGPLVRFTSISVLADFECASLDPAELNDALVAAVNAFTSRDAANTPLPLADLFPAQFGAASSPYVAPPLTLVDVRSAQAHDTCSACKSVGSLRETRAIEVGHTFYLGERYSRALEAGFVPSNEARAQTEGVKRLQNGRVPFQMGCYGIGVSRILGALAQRAAADFDESFNRASAAAVKSKAGFLWPSEIAPFTAVILVSDVKDQRKLHAAHDVWHRIIRSARSTDRGVRSVLESIVAVHSPQRQPAPADQGWSTDQASEVVIDDRTASLGSKMADSDLTGYAFRIIVGRHYSAEGKVEVQHHSGAGWQSILLPLDAF